MENKIKVFEKVLKNKIEFAKGCHSKIYESNFENKKIIIKENKFNNEREIFFLKKLQKYNFIPKLYFYDKKIIIIEKFIGKTIKEFLEDKTINLKIKKRIVLKIKNICEILDKLKINKMEMGNPYKHIFIEKYNVIKFIDFERSKFTNRPKNLNQFNEYLRRYDFLK